MKTYEYQIIKMEPAETDCDIVEDMLNENGAEGFRFIGIHKLWARDSEYNAIQRNFLILEKASQEEL
jgi:hypothetical protein